MNFSFITRANTYFGEDCVKKQADNWVTGSRALILTGAKSGRLSGALSDAEEALHSKGIPYTVFEGVENNPSVEQCQTLAKMSRDFSADFIVAVGGGSPIDAAKAVAVLTYENVTADDMFANRFTRVLPLVAIPTTSGTGSEVTPWSVLTRHAITNKQSFGNILTVPAYALLDPKYTKSLSPRVTLDTAMDALSHCIEGIFSIKSTPVSDALALHGIRLFADCLSALESGGFDSCRDELMLASMFGGMTIAHTGTTLIHGMGYPLTYFKGLSHGEANCYIMLSALNMLENASRDRVERAFSPLGMSVSDFVSYLLRVMPFDIELSEDDIASYTALSMPQGSLRNTPCKLDEALISGLYARARDVASNCHMK